MQTDEASYFFEVFVSESRGMNQSSEGNILYTPGTSSPQKNRSDEFVPL
jgi:hypothetical protein